MLNGAMHQCEGIIIGNQLQVALQQAKGQLKNQCSWQDSEPRSSVTPIELEELLRSQLGHSSWF